MAKYLVKAGYAVSITKGKIQNGKSVTYINYNIAEVQDEQTQKWDKPCIMDIRWKDCFLNA